MSKKITHKEHRQLLSGLYKRQGGKWIYQADAYIKQQEKREKLLELYREKEKHEQEFPALNHIEYEDYQRIKTEIWELENE